MKVQVFYTLRRINHGVYEVSNALINVINLIGEDKTGQRKKQFEESGLIKQKN